MKSEYGLCILCEKDLMITCPTCNHKKPGNNYTEVTLDLTNGSKMPIAVCLDCKDKVFHADMKALMAAVRAGWSKEHEKMNWPKENRDRYWATHGEGALEVVDAGVAS